MNTFRTNISSVILTSSFVILFSYLVFTTSAAAFITGSAIRCLNEGEDVRVSFLYNDPSASPMRCKCLNQEVVCRDPSFSKCTHNGKAYKSGETWKNGTCNKCSCSGGDVTCQFETCDSSLKCADNARLVHLPGDCCPSCVENDGECSLTGRKPFSLTSFDRKTCTFDGVCNYVMARDCGGKSFSIHLTHQVHEISPNETGETGTVGERIMSVVVKVDQTKVRLSRPQESWHIRVGRKPSVIPFIRLGVLTVLSSKSLVHVRTHLGVKVVWDGRQDLRITVPAKLKAKVCGLCGNFNSDPDDDQLTRKGRKVDDIDRFVSSWKVGKSGICAASHPTPSTTGLPVPMSRGRSDACSTSWKKKVAAMTACNKLKANAFRACHRSVPIAPFYKDCMADVCSCSKSDCHCKSIVAYINQCRGVGLEMSDAITEWKTLTSCDAPLNSSSSPPPEGMQYKIRGQEEPIRLSINSDSQDKKRLSCPTGSFFRPCTSPCKRTCKKKTGVSTCRRGCRPGCECAPHMVWHESRCIKPTLCPAPASFRLKEMLQ